METRPFGRTGHNSTVAIFGAVALSQATQEQADATMEQVIAAGVNHIDVAPSYGIAEERLGPWMARERDNFFLGCKTMERDREGAAAELRRSLERLKTDAFDLYQIHAITTFDELDLATRSGGALDAILEARQAGLTRFVGITGHGVDAPAIFIEALRRYDFDSVLFPLNFIQYADPNYRRNAEALIQLCQDKQVGTMTIKAIAANPWGDQPHSHITWYQPMTDPGQIQSAVNFVLSQQVTGLCTAGDPQVLPLILEACENYTRLTDDQQEAITATAGAFESIFTA
jgi:aryl-alcohol dehydrogenase-like predicted oxidoreductase